MIVKYRLRTGCLETGDLRMQGFSGGATKIMETTLFGPGIWGRWKRNSNRFPNIKCSIHWRNLMLFIRITCRI